MKKTRIVSINKIFIIIVVFIFISIIIPNIWGRIDCGKIEVCKKTDVLWIANLRKLKRAEWIIYAAELLPNVDFTMIGGVAGDYQYYSNIEERAKHISNLHFLGQKSFWEVNDWVANSRVVCCTSEYEGFPNTFLQAWSQKKPVVSTVDPSDMIVKNNLGFFVDSLDSFIKSIQILKDDNKIYSSLEENITVFFRKNYSTDNNYIQLMKYIDEEY